MKSFLFIFLMLINGSIAFAQSLSGEDILKKIDANLNFDTMSYVATMQITTGSATRSKSMQGTVKSNTHAYVEFLNAEDIGKKYLKINKDLWMYFPSENDTVKISGHLLKDGIMGSDVSYEDMLESDSLYAKYDIVLSGEENLNGNLCYVVTLTARVANVSYYKRVMWIDKNRFVQWKEEMYAKNGTTLLKQMNTLEIAEISGRYYPIKQEIKDMLKKNSKTTITMSDIKFNVEIPNTLFNLRSLRR